MSHLKKLSDRLVKPAVPSVQPIILLNTHLQSLLLERPSYRFPSISKAAKEFQIPSLISTASFHGLASLSASQIGFNTSAFVIHKSLEPDKWTGYKGNFYDYSVYINPTVLNVKADTNSAFEQCPSIPNVVTQVERYNEVAVEFINFDGEYVQENLKDFKARVFMHENDHVEGFLMTDFSVSFGRIFVIDQGKNKKLVAAVKEMKQKIADEVEKYEQIAQGQETQNSDMANICFERVVLNQSFEQEFRDVIEMAITEDTLPSK